MIIKDKEKFNNELSKVLEEKILTWVKTCDIKEKNANDDSILKIACENLLILRNSKGLFNALIDEINYYKPKSFSIGGLNKRSILINFQIYCDQNDFDYITEDEVIKIMSKAIFDDVLKPFSVYINGNEQKLKINEEEELYFKKHEFKVFVINKDNKDKLSVFDERGWVINAENLLISNLSNIDYVVSEQGETIECDTLSLKEELRKLNPAFNLDLSSLPYSTWRVKNQPLMKDFLKSNDLKREYSKRVLTKIVDDQNFLSEISAYSIKSLVDYCYESIVEIKSTVSNILKVKKVYSSSTNKEKIYSSEDKNLYLIENINNFKHWQNDAEKYLKAYLILIEKLEELNMLTINEKIKFFSSILNAFSDPGNGLLVIGNQMLIEFDETLLSFLTYEDVISSDIKVQYLDAYINKLNEKTKIRDKSVCLEKKIVQIDFSEIDVRMSGTHLISKMFYQNLAIFMNDNDYLNFYLKKDSLMCVVEKDIPKEVIINTLVKICKNKKVLIDKEKILDNMEWILLVIREEFLVAKTMKPNTMEVNNRRKI